MKKRSLYVVALPLAIVIELAGLGATIYGYMALETNAREADAERFGRLVDAQMADITARLESYESVLYGAAGLLNGSREVSAEEWRRYVQSIPLDQTAPGILGVGTIIPVPSAQRDEVIGRLSRLRGESFQYKTINGAPPPAEMSYVIDRIEPISRNRTAHGLDIGSEHNRRQAYEKARDSGKPQVTGIVSLVQDDLNAPGFLLIIPRYQMGMPLETVDERRRAFLDAVYAPMIGQDILSLPASSVTKEIGFSVYDEQESPARLIYKTSESDGSQALLEEVTAWPYAGREWLIHTWTTSQFLSKAAAKHQEQFLYFGVGLSSMLAMLLFVLHRSHGRALRLVEKYHDEADEKTRINELFVQHAPAALAILDTELCFLAVSRRWMKQFDLEEDIIGRHHYDVFPEIHDIPEWKEAHRRGLSGESLSGGDDRFERSNGTVQYLRWEIHPWHRAGGEIGGIIVFSQDVTEEVENRRRLDKAQQEIVMVEERLRQATEAGHVGIWDWWIEEDRLTWNDQMFELFGVSPGDFAGGIADFRRAVLEEDVVMVEEAMRDAVEEGLDFEIEYRTCRRDHPTVLAVGQVHRDPEGRPLRMLGVCVDVSEQVRMRRELKQAIDHQAIARRQAENMARDRERFLATMSHEIRTPMNGMIGMSELLLQTELNGRQKEYAHTIIQCGQSLLGLINDILDLSRIEAGAVQIESHPYEPVALMTRVTRMMARQAEKKGLKLSDEIGTGVPAKVMGDESRVQQILLNLMANAIKFTSTGSVRCALALETDERGRAVLVYRIADTGVGMSQDELEKVFLPFVQADASITRKYGGTGLGLSISRSLSLLMGGSLHLESEPGKGCTATVRLPLVRCDGTSSVEGEPESPAPIGWNGRPILGRLLIVEDNPVNQRVTELQMKRYAREIEIAGNGSQAIECFSGGGFDLILMDCQMPELDGFEATRRIRKLEEEGGFRRTPVIALTANVQDQDRQRAHDSGMDGFLAKPLQMEQWEQELRRLFPQNGKAEHGTASA